jgi:murein DD-endopeptidase MepM/ murein hydrolase activator NlpD
MYSAKVKQYKKLGFEADNDKKYIKKYLKDLRDLQSLHDKIEKSYKKNLYKSINDNNVSTFNKITGVFLPLLNSDARLKESVVNYYQKSKIKKVQKLEILSQDLKLDLKSYTYFDAMFNTEKKDQKVKKRDSLSDFKPDPTRKKLVEVVMVKTKTGFKLYLENHAYYDASIKLKAVKLVNLRPSSKLPYVGSFPARSRTEFFEFKFKNKHKKSLIRLSYSRFIGKIVRNFDRNYLYSLPYTRGKSYRLTQGFNGKQTHKGKSAYALDFDMPIGSKIHAMRDGIVIAVESKHTEHGFSPKFMNKANHIIIQHTDGTMAMYAHLKPNGVKVKLGQKVYKHQFIGLTGNTGYSSGPHLHVHISAIQNLNSGSSSVPFVFNTKQGKIKIPKTMSRYIAK